VIVGSALVRRILEAPDFDQGREAVSAAVAALAAALSG
jgi:tryptophan synthase alpha subunit